MSNAGETPQISSQEIDQTRKISEQFVKYTDEIARRDLLPSAPIQLPSEEQMTVRMVKLEDLLHFDEVRGEQSTLATLLSICAGAEIGIISNVVTSGAPANGATLATGACVVVFFAVLSFLYRRASKRVEIAHIKLFWHTP